MNTRLFSSLAVIVLLCGDVSAAQDRVILFDSAKQSGPSIFPMLPGEIQEIEVTEGGRGWSVVRTVELPPHFATSLVPLADGSRLLWLVAVSPSSAGSKMLAQYDVATGRAALVDIGRFGSEAKLVADKLVARVFVVEPSKVTFIDARLQPSSMMLSDPKTNLAAFAADRYLFVHRYDPAPVQEEGEVVVIDIERREVVRTLRLTAVFPASQLRVSRDGQRLYHAYTSYHAYTPTGGLRYERRLDVLSIATGELIARTTDAPSQLFELDDARQLVIHDRYDRNGRNASIVARHAATLALVGELAPGAFAPRRHLALVQTSREAAIVVFSTGFAGRMEFDPCITPGSTPRFDVFDGRTFELVNRIDLQIVWGCPWIVPLPPR